MTSPTTSSSTSSTALPTVRPPGLRRSHGWGRDFAAGVGDLAEAIEREVTRRMRPGIDPEVVKLAVEDALENCWPRW